MKKKLLLLQDVYGLGRAGEIVTAKPGYIRNFLIPKQKAVVAGEHTIRLQEKLRDDRVKQAIVDKKDSEELARKLSGQVIQTTVKVDQEGHLYGSVTATEIAKLLSEQLQVTIDRRNVSLPHGIKTLGVHEVTLKLKEGVFAKVPLQIKAEGAAEE